MTNTTTTENTLQPNLLDQTQYEEFSKILDDLAGKTEVYDPSITSEMVYGPPLDKSSGKVRSIEGVEFRMPIQGKTYILQYLKDNSVKLKVMDPDAENEADKIKDVDYSTLEDSAKFKAAMDKLQEIGKPLMSSYVMIHIRYFSALLLPFYSVAAELGLKLTDDNQ